MKASEEQARALGLPPQRLRVAGTNPDLEGAFAAVKQQHADAVLVLKEPVLGAPSRVAAGGLISYGTSQTEAIRHMTAYVDKVLKGAKPDALPVETVRRYELVVNLKPLGTSVSRSGYEAFAEVMGERREVHRFSTRSMAGGGAFHRTYYHATQQAFLAHAIVGGQ